MSKTLRIGVYAGTFDPVHAGHVAFALQAIEAAQLDEVIFMPERRPRFKPGVEHFAHRLAMLKTVIKPYPQLSVAELVDKQFSVHRTMHHIRQALPRNAQLVFLFGSDAAMLIPTWPNATDLLKTSELVIAARDDRAEQTAASIIAGWPAQPLALTVFKAQAPQVSSTAVRAALRAGHYTRGLLTSVQRYAKRQWLYISLHRGN